jgi:pilus assembly protein FimV
MLICLLLKITRGRAVRKFPYKTWLWAGIFLLYPWVAYAAGLGKLTVLSSLGQPLSAEIDLVSVQKDELSTLSARVASPDAFQQANMQYSPALIGIRMTIERRGDGKPFIRIVSTRSINDPFLGILIELTWAQGRLLREYTALIDPPGYTPTPAPVTPPVAAITPVAPPASPESRPIAPTPQPESSAAVAPSSKPSRKAAPVAPPASATVEGNDYAVKRGDTLTKIAAGVKPEGVTLDQMLVGLYRNNTDAFSGGNMNRLKTGTILRVPEKERISETAPAEATKEVRVQASNWNAYRLKLAEAAGNAPAQETTKSAAGGKITTAVEDKAAAKDAPKEVLKLSKGDTPAPGKAAGGKPMSAKDRMRMLEEEAVAREKSLAEANERVAQLEKNIKDMQRLLEIKGSKPPVAPAPPAKADQVAKAEPAKAEPPKAEPPKMEPLKDAAKAAVEPANSDQKSADQKGPPVVVEPPKVEEPKAAEAPKVEAPKAAPPQPKEALPPPPVAEPGLVDQIMAAASDPIYLAGGLGGLILLGGGALWAARRRRAQTFDDDVKSAKTAPTLAGTAAPAAAVTTSPLLSAVSGSDDVDPLAEADLYLNFGRDAQAEEVLKEALQKNPQHSEAQLKLLQIYGARKDKAAFEKVANNLRTQTSGVGDTWIKAAGMGYAFDPDNVLYVAGKLAPTAAAPAATGPIGGTDLDFDLELSPGAGAGSTTDLPLDSGDKTMMMQPGELAGLTGSFDDSTATHDITHDSVVAQAFSPEPAATPDFTLNPSAAGTPANVPDFMVDAGPDDQTKTTTLTGDSAVKSMVSAIDFNFDSPPSSLVTPALPVAPAGLKHDSTMVLTPENQANAADLTMDIEVGGVPASTPATVTMTGASSVIQIDPTFKLDFGGDVPAVAGAKTAGAAPAIPDIKLDGISLSLDDAPTADSPASAAGGAKDDHWYDVQTKFDLAKAYQEMGDKDGAREILDEVIKEGDSAQQAEAKQLLDSLG